MVLHKVEQPITPQAKPQRRRPKERRELLSTDAFADPLSITGDCFSLVDRYLYTLFSTPVNK